MKCILSFDDGPNTVCTSALLDILGKYRVPAIFFVIGKHAAAHPDLILRMHKEGHEIGNHTYNHKYVARLSQEDMEKEIISTQITIDEIIHQKPRLFRPPYGEYDTRTQEVCNREGLKIMIWNMDSNDWKSKNSEAISQKIIENAREGDVMLFHDLPQTVIALPSIIKALQMKQLL